MKKQEAEKHFNEEYSEICKQVYIDYMKGLRDRLTKDSNQHLLLFKSGIAEKVLCSYVKDIFNKYENSIIDLLETIKNEFEISMTKNFLNCFEEKNSKNIDGYFKGIEKKIEEIIGMEIQETTKTQLYNIKQNIKVETIKKIKKKNESIERLLKKEKSKKNNLVNIIKNLTIENIIKTIISFLMGLFVGNIDEIINIIKNCIN